MSAGMISIITCDDEHGCDQWIVDWYVVTASNWRDLMAGWQYDPLNPGWRGFDRIGERVDGGYEYVCDGMPRLMGCGERITVSRRWTKVGVKKSGWLVCYGQCFPDETADDDQGHDLDVVLTFCPSCAEHVRNFPTPSRGDETTPGVGRGCV